MSFGKLLTVISSLFCGQSLSPTKCADYFWLTINNFFVGIWQGVCSLFYWLCKWLLAVVDFLQYFIQKLIGLDYWLKPGSKTWSGAIKNDILFSFLYNDTVQRVFRAMVGVFIVLLIVFTIVQIVRQEWQYITGNNFGDGKSNSKAEIMRRSIKAFALVLVFPMILTVGIISSNSILASLVKALNIDMATTFGGTLFSISAQSANKYRLYASTDKRYAASSKVVFYSSGDQVLLFNGTGTTKDDTTYEKYFTDYKEYLSAINGTGVTKHVVDSMIEPINPMKYGKKNPFSGYCFSIPNGDKRKLFMAYCTSAEKDSMRLYLKGVLKVDVLTKSNNFSSDIVKTANVGADGFISKLELEDQSKGDLITACYNTWSYSTIYNLSDSFSNTLQFKVIDGSDLSGKYNISSVSNAKIIYNSDQISSYFDGGQTGFVQMQSEYNVMADVVDFMNDKQATLYMLDITSSLIDWSYSDSVNGSNYQVDSKWLGTANVDVGEKYKSFVVSYSEECSDTETGNVLYLAKASAGSELEGSKYIMCWKVVSGGQSKFIPLVNGKSFKDPDTLQSYTFKSDYLESSYRGVILAKGLLDANSGGSTNKKVGEPTYIQSDIYKEDGSSAISVDKPYYYDLKQEGYLLQFASGVSNLTQGGYSVATIQFSSEYSSEGYSTNIKDFGSGDKIIQLIQDSDVKSFTDDIIKNLTINLQNSTVGIFSVYAGVESSKANSKLYLFKAGNLGYFVVEWDSTVNGIRIKGLNGQTISEKGLTTGITITKPTYNINYVYNNNGSTANGELITGLTPEDFEYSSTDGDYSLFQTTDRQTVSFGGVTKTMYINAFFNTDRSALMSFGTDGVGQNIVKYANGLGNTVGTADEKYTQKTEFYRVDLYNYLTGVAGGGLYEYDIETKEVSTGTVSAPDESDNEFVKKFNMNASDFTWDKNSDSIALYDGKNYVATLYKPYGNDENLGYPSGTTSISDFFNSKSIKILIDGNEYYNIRTQNTFTDKGSMKNYYTNSLSDLRIGFYRDNLDDVVVLKVDFNFSLVGNMRFYLRAFLREMDTINTNSFELYDGISFDYFFDGDIDLYDFYVPSKISYWIILIASALIIKVLGNALWGVIKRFYEITMYFIAMPAVASTIPLDDGSRFNKQIQTPLISKVLSTYGVILGINVFFILLAPVKSISQIFTVEDLETSGSYFLKHLPIPVKWLNNYVYILFVLVAFTMINALPKTISGLIGAGEVSADGATAKETSAKQMKSAGDIISGRAGMNAIGDLGKKATGMIPFSEPAKRAAGKVGGGIKNIFDKTKDKDESSGGGGSSRATGDSESGSSRADGEGESGGESGENAPGMDSSQVADAVDEGVASSRAGTDVPAETDPMNSVAMENATTTTASDGTTAVADGSGAGGVLNPDAKEGVMGQVKADAVDSAVEAVQATGATEANGDVEVVAENLAEEKAEQATEQSTEKLDQSIDAKTEEKADEKIGESKPKTLADEIKEKSDKQVNFIKALPETVGNAVSKFGNVLSKPFVAAGKGIATGASWVGGKVKEGAGWIGDKTKKFVKASGETMAKVGQAMAKPFVAVGKKVSEGAGWVAGKVKEGAEFVGDKTKKFVKASGETLKKAGEKMAKPFVAAGKGIATGANWIGGKVKDGARWVGDKAGFVAGKVKDGAGWIGDKTKKFVKASGETMAKVGKTMATPFVAVGKKVSAGAEKVKGFIASVPDRTKSYINNHPKLKSVVVTTAATGLTAYRGISWLGKKTATAAKDVGNKLTNSKAGRAVLSGTLVAKEKTSEFATRVSNAVSGLPVVSSINKKLHRSRSVSAGVADEETTVPVNSHNEIHIASSLTGKGATGKGRTSGQIIAKAIEEGRDLTAEQIEGITVSEFNEQAISDQNFIDNKTSARANVIRNKVGTKIGRQVTAEVLSTYAETEIDPQLANSSASKKIATAIVGGNGKKGLLSQAMKTELVKSTMSKSELENFEQLSSAEQSKVVSKYKTSAIVKADGSIGFAVADDKGKVNVNQKTADKVVSQMLSSESVKDSAIETAIEKTGAKENVDLALSQNIASGINFNKENASSSTSLMANAVYERASQNDDIVAEAMLRHIESNKTSNPELYNRFQSEFNLGDADLGDSVTRGRVIEQIKMFNKSDNANVINTMSKDSYANEFTGLVQEKVNDGSFKVTAWQIADDESKAEFSAKTATNLKNITNSSILDGATQSEKVNIIANTATNLMSQRGDTAESRKIQDTAFIKNVSNQELRSLDQETLSNLVGRSVEVEDLTAEDKAFLGFVKARNGGSFDGVNTDAVSVSKYRNASMNGSARINAFNSLSNNIKANAVIENNKQDVYAQIATQDATYAMTKESLVKVQASYAQNMKNSPEKQELDRMFKQFTGKDDASISTASTKQLASFFTKNNKAANIVTSQMRESGVDFNAYVNKNYQPTFTRTSEEQKAEYNMSISAVKKNAPASIYNAFVTSDIENKDILANQMFAQYANIENVNSDVYKGAISDMKANNVNIDALIMRGNSEANIVMAYKKAQMMGDIGINGSGANEDVINEYLNLTTSQTNQMLRQMQNLSAEQHSALFAGGASYEKVANTLANDRITEGQKSALIETAAKSGYSAMSENEQVAIVENLGMKDGEIRDNATIAKYLKTNQTEFSTNMAELSADDKDKILAVAKTNNISANDTDVREYLASNNGKEDKERLANKAKKMSYYEIDSTVNGDATSEQVYETIKGQVSKEQQVEELYQRQGDLIDNESVQKTIAESGDVVASDYVASAYAEKINTISKSEEQEIRVNAEYSALDADTIASIRGSKEATIESAKTRALYTEFMSNDRYSAYISSIRKSDEYKAESKKEGFNAETYITNKMVKMLTAGGLVSDIGARPNRIRINNISARAEKQAIIAEAVARDSSLGIELESVGNEAVELKNKQRLAFGGANRVNIFADAIKENSNLYKKARIAFRSQKGYEGKELEEVDESTRNNFLANTFANSLNEEEKQTISKSTEQQNKEYIKSVLGDDAEEKIKATKSSITGKNFSDISQFIFQAESMGISIDKALEDYGLSGATSRISSGAAKFYNKANEKSGKKFNDLSESERLQKVAEYEYAKKLYEEENAGKGLKFENASFEKKAIMLNGFSENQSKQAIHEYLNSSIVKNMSKSDFNDIYESSKHENYGEESSVFKNVKKNIISKQLDDSSEIDRIEKTISRNDSSVIELARTDATVVAKLGENASDKDISKFLSSKTKLANSLKRTVAENMFIEQTLGATYEGQDVSMLSADQRATALTLARSAKITIGADVSKLSGKDKRDYEYRRNIIQQEIRNDANPQILANTFKNTTLVNESKIVSDMVGGNTQADILKNKIALLKNNEEFMAKTYGLILGSNNKNSVAVKEAIVSDYEKNSERKYDSLSVSEKNSILAKYMQNAEFIKNNNLTKSVEKVNASFNSEISKYAMKATSTELKQGLSEEQINSYLKSHENIKDQLVSIAASDVSLTLDKETQSARKIDAVMSNASLQRQTAVHMMKEQFDSSQIYTEIVKMLTNSSSKFYDAKFASELNKISDINGRDTFARNYINKDYSEMLAKVSTETYFEYNKQGQARLKETVNGQDVADSMNKAINKLSENSKLYNDTVNGLVTKVIDPAHRATDAEKSNFFASTNTKTANKQLQDLNYNFSSVRNTMTNFYKVNAGGESEFAGFLNASTSAVPNGVYTNNNNIVKIENGEFKSAIYKQKRKLPETSKKYDEWNANLQKEIDKAKRGKGVYETMSRSQREAHVQDLEARKIRTTLPDNFASMTNEDQIKFRKAQNALKNEALNVNYSKLIKNVQKYGAPSKKASREFAKENGQKLTRKEVKTEAEIVKHKQTLTDIESSITRFNATKAMRNKNVDFGSNFNKFASNYLSEKDLDKLTDKINKKFAEQTKGQVDNLGRTITQKSMPKFADMNDSQKRTMINIREEALKEELNREHKVALKKVKNDSLKNGTSLNDDAVRSVRYKNATPKFTHQHGKLNKVVAEYNKQYRENNGVVDPKIKKAYDKMYGTGGVESKVKKQNDLINLKTQYDKVVAFNNSFKGDKSEYRRQLQELLGDSQIVNNVYRRYGALFGSGEKGPFSLANSPVAVQKNEIANGIMRQLRNAEYRLNGKYKGYIPANSQSNTEYVGKAFTNARKQVEMDNTKRVAGELNSALKQFNTNSKSLSYDQLYSMLKPYMRDSFKAGKRKDFVTYSDETKKELLRKHLENSLTKANNRVNNDSFFGSDKSKLMKLNGTYIERKEVNTGTTSRIVGSEVYQNLVKNFNNAKTKVDLEQLNIDRLSRTLKEKMNGPQTLQTRREINSLRQSLEASRIRMKTYRSIYDDAGSKKRSFEQAYASKQIAQAKGVNDSIKYHANASKALFDNYRFPIKPKPGDPMDPRFVRPGTPDAKMVENAIGRFIMRYKNQMQMMVKSMVKPELKDLNNYISGVANKLTDDFAKNVSDLRRTERKLKEELKKLSNKTDRKSLQMKEQIETGLQQLKANEKDLIQKLDSMGIDIKEIQAIK